MRKQRQYKIPLKQIILLFVLYSSLVAFILTITNHRDFIDLTILQVLIASIVIGSIITFIHAKLN